MQPKEISSFTLYNLKRSIDKLDPVQISSLFHQTNIDKTTLFKICSYLYTNDRKTFDYFELLILNCPKTINEIAPTNVQINFPISSNETPWKYTKIHPLFRPLTADFNSRILTSSLNRFTQHFPKIESNYYVVLNSPTCQHFYIDLIIERYQVLTSKYPVSSFPINVTDFICEGYCHFCVSFENLNGFVSFGVFALEKLTPQKIESEVINGRPHLKGGKLSFCPISHSLIKVPVRGINCEHTSLFDLHSYINSAITSSLWECPICEKSLPFEELALDEDAYTEIRNLVLENPNFFFSSL